MFPLGFPLVHAFADVDMASQMFGSLAGRVSNPHPSADDGVWDDDNFGIESEEEVVSVEPIGLASDDEISDGELRSLSRASSMMPTTNGTLAGGRSHDLFATFKLLARRHSFGDSLADLTSDNLQQHERRLRVHAELHHGSNCGHTGVCYTGEDLICFRQRAHAAWLSSLVGQVICPDVAHRIVCFTDDMSPSASILELVASECNEDISLQVVTDQEADILPWHHRWVPREEQHP